MNNHKCAHIIKHFSNIFKLDLSNFFLRPSLALKHFQCDSCFHFKNKHYEISPAAKWSYMKAWVFEQC